MTRSHFVLASGLCSFAAATFAGVTGAGAQAVYVDEDAYTAPAYVAPVAPPAYYVAPQGYVAAPAYAAPAAPLTVVPVALPAYAAAPAYVAPVAPPAYVPAPAITPRERVIRRIIVQPGPAYPRYDRYGYVTYQDR